MKTTNNYEILGVKKDATRDEITRAFKMHLTKHQNLGSKKAKEQENEFNRITQAYNELMGYNTPEEVSAEKQNPVLRFLRIDQDKLENFWMYNKVKVYTGIFVTIVLLMLISQSVNREEYDFSLALMGDFTMSDSDGDEIYLNTKTISTYLDEGSEGINSPLVNYFMDSLYSNDPGSQGGLAGSQKFATKLFSGDIDFFILNEDVFKQHAAKGFLEDVSEFANEHEVDTARLIEGTYAPKSQEQTTAIYGIDITESEFVVENRFYLEEGEIVIAAICVNGKNKETAYDFLKNTI